MMTSMQTITISLPEGVYERIKRQSQQNRRTVGDEVVAAVLETLPNDEQLPGDIEQELAQLDTLTVEDLWAAARLTAPPDKEGQMQALLDRQDMEGLTPSEQQEARLLAHFFNRIMLIRAKAAVLLQERGQDIDVLRKRP
jgi:hypothetical protein